MPDMDFNTTAGQTVAREMLIAYLNTGESGTPTWSPIGKRVEDSSIEFEDVYKRQVQLSELLRNVAIFSKK